MSKNSNKASGASVLKQEDRVLRRATIRKKKIENFGNRLREERERRGMTRPQVAEGARISEGTLHKIENGIIKKPAITTVMDLMHALGVNKPAVLARLLGLGAQPNLESSDFTNTFWAKRHRKWGDGGK